MHNLLYGLSNCNQEPEKLTEIKNNFVRLNPVYISANEGIGLEDLKNRLSKELQ